MKRWMMMAAWLLISGGLAMYAQDKVTVEATREDISEGLDLKAVATLFGEVKDLTEFEEKLNSSKLHLSNLDLNGDGTVDYLRVVEVEEAKNKHLVIIQAVLAKDVFQDIASIYVESKADKTVAVQVIGDEYVYGVNYVIEPVYIYRPVIYDWFWGPGWVCYSSPWYWGYWPGWYAPYPCWGCRDYWVHVHVYHYDHPRCSYRYAQACSDAYRMRQVSGRSDYAQTNKSSSFAARTGVSSARELRTPTRYSSYEGGRTSASSGTTPTVSSRGATYGSRNTSAYRTTYSSGATTSSRGTSYTTTTASRGSSYSTSSGSRTSSSGTTYSPSTTSRGSSYSGSSYSGTSTYSGRTSGSYSSGSSSSRGSSYSGGSSSYSGGGSRGSSYSGGGSTGGRGSAYSGGGGSSRR